MELTPEGREATRFADTGRACSRQQEQEVQRPWGGTLLGPWRAVGARSGVSVGEMERGEA